jgi:predicted nuclease of predicted toxin-antitoxin system
VRILLDECLPRKLKRELEAHEAFTVPEMGWAGIKNGALLKLAEAQFDIFLTIDSNLEFQQNIIKFNIAIIALVAKSNDIDTLRPLIPEVIKSIPSIEKGKVWHVEIDVGTPILEQNTNKTDLE